MEIMILKEELKVGNDKDLNVPGGGRREIMVIGDPKGEIGTPTRHQGAKIAIGIKK